MIDGRGGGGGSKSRVEDGFSFRPSNEFGLTSTIEQPTDSYQFSFRVKIDAVCLPAQG